MAVAAQVIAIDGPSGSGKGTVAARVANRVGWHLLDSGALYRILAFAASERSISTDDGAALAALARQLDLQFLPASDYSRVDVVLDAKTVTDSIRTEKIGEMASKIAAIAEVRSALLRKQRAFRRPPGLVADGRDMGTVVFPDAGLKVFLTACVEERANRRYKQLKSTGQAVSLPDLLDDIRARDRRDTERAVAPLRAAPDAVQLDSTALTIDAVVEWVLQEARNKRLIA